MKVSIYRRYRSARFGFETGKWGHHGERMFHVWWGSPTHHRWWAMGIWITLTGRK
jgi:hypothetical protein